MKIAVRSAIYVCKVMLVAGLLGLGWTGCLGPVPLNDSAREGPFYTPSNFVGETVMPAGLHRVVLLPSYSPDPALAETAASLDQILLVALQKQARFEVVPLGRGDSRRWFGAEAFASTGLLPFGYVQEIAAKMGADALLLVDLTDYKPYRPLRVGFRAKLVTAKEVRIIWAFDEVIAAEYPGVVNAARRHAMAADRQGPPVDLSPAILQSPGRFAGFAADLMFQTLPPR